MKTVYVAHPLHGATGSPREIEINMDRIEMIMEQLSYIFHDFLLLSPIHAFSFYDPNCEQIQVMEQCFALLEKCDELWLFDTWQESKGCLQELKHAKAEGLKIRYMKNIKEVTK